MRTFPTLLAGALLLAGCGSPCEDLADRICLCQTDGADRENCRRAVQDQLEDGDPKPGKSEQDFCEEKLATCPKPSDDENMCDRLSTPQGKFSCGLAFEPPPAPEPPAPATAP